ncbi:MAG: hypothetical protein LC749_06835, partial [Actinobacteria bacterium]|nr:hypothetical protein [Actinomycetota bacterium]
AMSSTLLSLRLPTETPHSEPYVQVTALQHQPEAPYPAKLGSVVGHHHRHDAAWSWAIILKCWLVWPWLRADFSLTATGPS